MEKITSREILHQIREEAAKKISDSRCRILICRLHPIRLIAGGHLIGLFLMRCLLFIFFMLHFLIVFHVRSTPLFCFLSKNGMNSIHYTEIR